MKLRSLFVGIVIAFCAFSAKATVFNFSYTFDAANSGVVVSGSLTGTLNGVYIQNVSNVSVIFNNTPFVTGTGLYQPWSFSAGCCYVNVAGVISTNANLNNFYFSDSAPYLSAQNTFIINGTDTTGSGPLRHAYVYLGGQIVARDILTDGNPGYDPDQEFSASRWSITAVPEPGTLALLGLGLFGLGFRRKA